MSIFELMDLLEDEIEQSPKVVMSSMHKVDPERLLQIVHQMREELPEEIHEAEGIFREKGRILKEAKARAEEILAKAQAQAEDLCSEHEIVAMATNRANEIMAAAQHNAREVRAGAKAYAEDLMSDLESYLSESLEIVRKNKTSLSGKG